jgi:hypothetical protein
MNMTASWMRYVVAGLGLLSIAAGGAGTLDESAATAGEWGFRPAMGEIVALSPPSFSWRPQEGATSYQLQIGRDPSLVRYAGGMRPGLDNPLGARALYLYQDGVYTLYTIYGTVAARSIGTGVSSGCIGLLSQDIIHLHSRTPVGTKVIVLPA